MTGTAVLVAPGRIYTVPSIVVNTPAGGPYGPVYPAGGPWLATRAAVDRKMCAREIFILST